MKSPAGVERNETPVGFRVKAPVTRRPPHRSGREALPYPVPRCYPFLRIGPGMRHSAWHRTLSAQALDIENDLRLQQRIYTSLLLSGCMSDLLCNSLAFC